QHRVFSLPGRDAARRRRRRRTQPGAARQAPGERRGVPDQRGHRRPLRDPGRDLQPSEPARGLRVSRCRGTPPRPRTRGGGGGRLLTALDDAAGDAASRVAAGLAGIVVGAGVQYERRPVAFQQAVVAVAEGDVLIVCAEATGAVLADYEVGEVACMRARRCLAAVLAAFRREVTTGALERRRVTDPALVDVQAVLAGRNSGDTHAYRHAVLSLDEGGDSDSAAPTVDEHRFRTRDDWAERRVLGCR